MTDTGQYVLGIDAGTGGLRAGLFDLHGTPLGFADQPYGTSYPQPGRAVQDPGDWWLALVTSVRTCLTQAAVDPAQVRGLAIDAPANIFLVDSQGTPLTPGLLWMDLRGAEQAGRLTATNDPVLRFCGGTVPAEWPLPKALWLKEQQPELWQRSHLLVETMGWLTWRLTGTWTLGLCSAACKWHYRPGTGWPASLLETGGLGGLTGKLPDAVLPMGGRVGTLTAAAAEALGLTTGTVVSLSGIDAHAGMVGIDALQPGVLALITGSSTCQLALSRDPIFDPGIWGPFESAVTDGDWVLEAGQASTGSAVRWLLDLLDGSALGVAPDSDRYGPIEALAAAVPPGAEGVGLLDHWQGSRTPIRDSGARGAITGLSLGHGPGHLLRTVYEGTAYGNRRILDRLAERGVPIERIVACGGGTRSALWMQILADVAGRSISITEVPDAVTLGSAICAAVGAGCYPDLRAGAAAMVRPARTIEPDPSTRAVYEEGYLRYIATYEALHAVRTATEGHDGRVDREVL